MGLKRQKGKKTLTVANYGSGWEEVGRVILLRGREESGAGL